MRATTLLLLWLVLPVPPPAIASAPPVVGGSFAPAAGPCLPPAAREAIRARLDRATAELGLARDRVAAPPPQLAWPLRAQGIDDPGYHGISNFVDHDPASPGALQDFECGTRSYDLANGYDHRGTDFFNWPFAWNKMDRGEVLVVAAAPGTILAIDDGNADRSCGFGGADWNAVYIRHADGSEAWYGHLAQGSTAGRLPGQAVATGDVLGLVGSSGQSTGPHLHLELYDSVGDLVDPWAGPCNPTTAQGWWAQQRPYHDSAINAIRTASAWPDFGSCPDPEQEFEQRRFDAGDTVRFVAYLRDQTDDAPVRYSVLRPDGSVFEQWLHVSNAPHYAASYWGWSHVLPPTAADGQWLFRVEYEGQVVERGFVVGEGVPVLQADLRGEREGGWVRLGWELPPGLGLDALRLERHVGGDRSSPTARPLDILGRELHEADPAPGEPLLYRLVGRSGGQEYRLGELALAAPATVLQLGPFAPNPTGAGGGTARVRLPAATAVEAGIFDLVGRRVATLWGGRHPAGELELRWDGRDAAGRPAAAGAYFLRVQAGGRELRARLLRLH